MNAAQKILGVVTSIAHTQLGFAYTIRLLLLAAYLQGRNLKIKLTIANQQHPRLLQLNRHNFFFNWKKKTLWNDVDKSIEHCVRIWSCNIYSLYIFSSFTWSSCSLRSFSKCERLHAIDTRVSCAHVNFNGREKLRESSASKMWHSSTVIPQRIQTYRLAGFLSVSKKKKINKSLLLYSGPPSPPSPPGISVVCVAHPFDIFVWFRSSAPVQIMWRHEAE